MKKIFFALVLLAGIGIMAFNFYTNESAPPASTGEAGASGLQPGMQAPNFELTDQNGSVVQLSDYEGTKVVLNFWATWCPPCRAEMPHMQQFHEDEHQDVEILAVNLTAQDNGREAIDAFIDEFGLTFSIPMDETGSTAQNYQVRTVPTTYIINTRGEIAEKIFGPVDEQVLEDKTDRID